MLKKDGKFYADWYDAYGKRRAKMFTNETEARRYERRQDALTLAVKLGRAAAFTLHYTRRKHHQVNLLLDEAHALALATAQGLDPRHSTPAQQQQVIDAQRKRRNLRRRLTRRNRSNAS